MSWVDLGTDVDWARRTVEQMEKVFVKKILERPFFGLYLNGGITLVRRSKWQNKNIQRVTALLLIPRCR